MLTAGVAALAVFAYSSDGAGKVARAQYCLSIDVTSETAEQLAQRFDAFARHTDLSIDASHPLMRVYFPPGGGGIYPTDSTAMIVLERMGPRGSILSYVTLRENPPPSLLGQLKRFVTEEISKSYRTVMCEEIKGFSGPELHY